MDFVLHLMSTPYGHPKVPAEDSGLYAVGDIVNVLELFRVTEPAHGKSRMMFSTVKNCPLTFDRIKLGLMEQWGDNEAEKTRGIWFYDFNVIPGNDRVVVWSKAQTALINKRNGKTLQQAIIDGEF